MRGAIHIMRAGRHTAMGGHTVAFGEADLAASAAAYDPALHEAPLVIGHPRIDAPAYGWVAGLTATADGLEATPHRVEPAFAELVRSGRFAKVSACFYAPYADGNPKTGVYYLRHVGFLGAQAPAVKGLRQVEFGSDLDEELVTVEFAAGDGDAAFADWIGLEQVTLWRRLREWLLRRYGPEDADQVLPAQTLDMLHTQHASEPPPPATPAAFAAPLSTQDSQQEITVNEQELAAREAALQEQAQQVAADRAALSERETAIAAAEQLQRERQVAAFVEQLESAGKVLPRHRDGLSACLLAFSEGATVAFGEGDTAFEGSLQTWLRKFLDELPTQVRFAELAGDTGEPAPVSDDEVARRASAYRDRIRKQGGRNLSFSEAVDAVRADRDRAA